MTWEATKALLYRDAEMAATGLRNELRLIALESDAEPDWSTFRLSEVTEFVGLDGRTWYEWTGVVRARRKSQLPVS